METSNEEKTTLEMHTRNVSLLMSALELKIKNLKKIQKNCVKERQFSAAHSVQYDINLLEGLLKRLIPLKPVPLPLK